MDNGVIWPMRQIMYRLHTLRTAIQIWHDLAKKKSHFWTPADLKWYLEMPSLALSHLTICKNKILVHYEFKVHINVVGRAKKLQKQVNYGWNMDK